MEAWFPKHHIIDLIDAREKEVDEIVAKHVKKEGHENCSLVRDANATKRVFKEKRDFLNNSNDGLVLMDSAEYTALSLSRDEAMERVKNSAEAKVTELFDKLFGK